MHITRMVSAVLAAGLMAGTVVVAQNGNPLNANSKNVLTLAVYGDSPYGLNNADTIQIEKTPAFIATINNDPKVDLVLHVGDIHSGKQFCTEAYDRSIFDLWLAFKNPVIYTPGDNEWTDCQKSGEGGGNPATYHSGDPIANLDLIRSIFFGVPGYTLGGRKKQVLTQAQNFDPASATDGDYVENVMWEQSQGLFVTLNVPGGSNNDDDKWFGVTKTQAQIDEVTNRMQADFHWLDAAFVRAAHDGAQAVLIQLQADMWDLDSKGIGHLTNYETLLASIASHTLAFNKPVLLINGDSHHYRSDNPLKDAQPCVFESAPGISTVNCNSIPNAIDYTQDAWDNHPNYDVPNFHRIVVHGSVEPMEWIRLTITPGANASASSNAFGPFAWQRIQPLP